MEKENYIVSARKYRPATFHDVVGQKSLTVTLKNAIASDRLAHAYLFCGSRGVGKTSCARIFAKTINCTHRTAEGEACNECESCRMFNENRSLNIIELDAASHNGIEDMRSIIDQVQVPPSSGRYRVFIIDEVHMLSTAAFNAFLKTLEEPPSYVIFILATTEKHKIIPTILSRCQIYDFNRISVQDMIEHLTYVAGREGYTVEPAALNVIAGRADGAMRDALSIFDQVAASSLGNITYASAIENLGVLDSNYYAQLVDAFLAGDVRQSLLLFRDIRVKGFDAQSFINGLGQYLRDLMVAGDPKTLSLLDAGDEVKAQMAERAQKCSPQFLYEAMDLCNEADLNYRTATNKQFLIELTLIKLCQHYSPTPIKRRGKGVGQLKPIAAPAGATPTAPAATQPTPAAPAAAPAPVAPAAAVAPQPVAQPTPRTMTAPAPQMRPTGRVLAPSISIRIHHQPEQQAANNTATAATPAAAQQHRAAQYTEDAMKEAWQTFINAHLTEHILVSTMRTTPLLRIAQDSDQYKLIVQNEIQQNIFNEVMPSLLKHMRDSLSNDSFSISVEVNQGEAPPETWNERQLYDHMIKESKTFAAFVKNMKLKL
jgi:DNA polymerase-3 subunit gamma/tau